jgi:hypothetical protein
MTWKVPASPLVSDFAKRQKLTKSDDLESTGKPISIRLRQTPKKPVKEKSGHTPEGV